MAHADHSWEILNDVLVSLTTAGPIPDHRWKPFLDDLKLKGVRRYLGASLGATELTSLQRKEAAEAVRDRRIKTAVVTDERLVRGIVTAASWLGAPIRSFSWADIQGVMKYLEIEAPLDERVSSWILKARLRVG